MKNVFILGSMICLLSACSKYQIHTLNSLKTPKDEQTGAFIVKNDTLEIVYKFGGEKDALEVQIKNKLDEPLNVNWKKSAFIIGNKAISYSGNKIDLNGEYNGTSARGSAYTDIQWGKMTGTATIPEETSFIPPHAMIDKKLLNVTSGLIALVKDSLKRLHVYQPETQTYYDVKLAKFSRENSPLVLKSYITLYIEKDKTLQVLPYEHEFYISQSVQTGKKPKNTRFYNASRSDNFYNFKRTGYSATLAIIGGVAILGVLGAANDGLDPVENK